MVLLGGALAASPAAAQDRMRRVGLLSAGLSVTAPGATTSFRGELVEVLAAHGFSLGRNLELVDRYAEGHVDRLPALAREIAAGGAEVILAITVAAVRAVLAATPATPIVMITGDDPVAAGFVASLARPGGRVTGIHFRTIEGDAKRLELLREALPGARRLGFLAYRGSGPATAQSLVRTAAQLDIELIVRAGDGPIEYATALAEMKGQGVAGVLIQAHQSMATEAVRVAINATTHGLATMCEWDYMARAGCAFGYGHDVVYAQRRVAEYVARILKGSPPGELPVEQPTAWKLTVNLAVVRQLKLVLPRALLARADEMIE